MLELLKAVGIGLPGVAKDGVLLTAANIDPAWVDFPVAEDLTAQLKRKVSIVNDATQHVGQAAFVRGVLERARG